MSSPFKKAERSKLKLRLWLSGLSSSGKTIGALLLAKGMGGKTALIDTEAGRGNLHANKFEYDTLELHKPFTPEKYVAAIVAAEQAGYDNIIVDSASHEWMEVLEVKSDIDVKNPTSNTFTNWAGPSKRHNTFWNAVTASPCHVIVTSRVKRDWVLNENEKGKLVPKMVGLANIQRDDGREYDMIAELRIDSNHLVTALKDNTELWLGKEPRMLTEEDGKALIAWLNEGKEVPKTA